MDKRYFSEKVVEWYDKHKRNLPWRDSNDPYKIWLSEIILQQTRVIQGLPYYLRFIEKYPDVKTLAEASEQEILRLWQGLGYYTRARNLHKCAKEIVSNYQGEFPKTFEMLKKLPGVGDYTAAAIASIAFLQPVAVVDGNVFRVLARIFGVAREINSLEGKKYFTSLANELITARHPHLHNQGVMEFGALHCTPQNPACESCIFLNSCVAAKNNLQQQLPVKAKAKATKKRYFYYIVAKKGKALLMKKREHKDIWHGLYDFYLVETKRAMQVKNVLAEVPFINGIVDADSMETSMAYKHVLTHQVIISKFIIIDYNKLFIKQEADFKYYSFKEISHLPKPVLISKFLEDYGFVVK